MAEEAARLTLDTRNKDLAKIGQFSDYARVKIRMVARKNKQSWTLVRIIPCPTVSVYDLEVTAADILNRVIADLLKDGFKAGHVGDGVLLVDWSDSVSQLQEQQPKTVDRVGTQHQTVHPEVRMAHRQQLSEMIRRMNVATAKSGRY